MSRSNTNPQESGRAGGDNTSLKARQQKKLVTQSSRQQDPGLHDWFLESADFLPDWLAAEAGDLGTDVVSLPIESEVEDSSDLEETIVSAAEPEPAPPDEPAPLPEPASLYEPAPQELLYESVQTEKVAVAVPDAVEAETSLQLPEPAPPDDPAPPGLLHESVRMEKEAVAVPDAVDAEPSLQLPEPAPLDEPAPLELLHKSAQMEKVAPAIPRAVGAEPSPQMKESPLPAASAPSVRRPKRKRRRTRNARGKEGLQRVPVRIFDRFALVLLALAMLLGILSVAIFRYSLLTYLAIQTATVARPQEPRQVAEVPGQSVQWCLVGDFLGEETENKILGDNGQQGDLVAEDGIFSLNQRVVVPGRHLWQVAACNNRQIIFPPSPAWVVTTSPDQLVTFTIDVTQTSRPLFLAARHVVSANDSASQFRVVGNFQEWNADDPSGVLQQADTDIFAGIYHQVRRIAQPGRYNAYVITGDKARGASVTAIDGYGRTIEPIPLSFQTHQPDDYVVFLLDLNQGRATVLYNMPFLLTRMAFGNGYLIVGAVVGMAASLSIIWLFWRSILLWRYRSWLEAGCPRCHNHELMRVERHPIDRLLQALGLPAYRYQCRNCPWQGLRLSMGGLSTSPRSKSRLAQAQQQ